MNRLLVADAQLFQTIAWHRGMGKYSLELLAAISAQRDVELQLLFSGRLPAEPDMLDRVRERVPGVDLAMLDLRPESPGDPTIAPHNRDVVQAHLAALPGAEFLVLSALQGIIRPVLPQIDGVRTHALVYDLIPLMFPELYLRDVFIRAEYLPRLAELPRADRFLAISRTVANDITGLLGIDVDRVVSIDGAPIGHAAEPVPYPTVRDPIILMPTGNDLRKNNRRAIRGFEEFNRARGGEYTLVVTSSFEPAQIAELSTLSPDVVFTGNVSGGELAELFRRAAALLFPPEYEGLGLPVLEAMESYRPVACSDIPVFREMSGTAFHLFDPLSVRQIARALGRAVDAGLAGTLDREEYDATLARYSWPRTASDLLATLDVPVAPAVAEESLPRVWFCTPDPDTGSIVGRFVREMHAELARVVRPRYLLDKDPRSLPGVLDAVPGSAVLAPGATLPRPEAGDLVVHHLGGEPAGAATLLAAAALPGVLVLHDVDLTPAWSRLVERGLVAPQRVAAEDRLEAIADVPGTAHLAAALAGQRAVVVFTQRHASLVGQVADRVGIDRPIHVIPAGTPGVVYPDALPPKAATITAGSAVAGVPERDDADRIMRSAFAAFDADAHLHEVLRVMRWGVIPCLPFDPADLGLPADVCVRYDGSTVENATAALLTDPDALGRFGERVRLYARTDHCPGRFAGALADVLKPLLSTDVVDDDAQARSA